MAKKTSCGEFTITINDDNSVAVKRDYDNIKLGLTEAAVANKFSGFSTQGKQSFGQKLSSLFSNAEKKENLEFANKLLDKFCDGARKGTIGEFRIDTDGNEVSVIRNYSNTKEGLRCCSDSIGFPYEKDWTTQQFGKFLVEHLKKKKK